MNAHSHRAMLALAMFHRYGGEDEKVTKRIRRFAGDSVAQRAHVLGLALRAALVMAGPAADLLGETAVKLTPSTLVVTIPKAHQALIAEPITKRLDALAEALDRTTRIEMR